MDFISSFLFALLLYCYLLFYLILPSLPLTATLKFTVISSPIIIIIIIIEHRWLFSLNFQQRKFPTFLFSMLLRHKCLAERIQCKCYKIECNEIQFNTLLPHLFISKFALVITCFAIREQNQTIITRY